MRVRWPGCLLWVVSLAAAGCFHPPVADHVDWTVCAVADRPRDLSAAPLPTMPPAEEAPPKKEPGGGGQPLTERLQVPPEIPGSKAPPVVLPNLSPENAEERKAAVNRQLPPLPPPPELPDPPPGPDGVPLTLADLQRVALANSPVIRQAAAKVEAARGEAVQAGLPPNPTVGYQADSINQADSSGLQGGFVEQVIKTGGKLQLARAAAAVGALNAELALRRAEYDLMTQVRKGYFAVLTARENVRLSHALARLTAEVYRIQVERVRPGASAPYEAVQVRALAVQARAALLQARNRYASAWKQLAAAMGTPGLPPAALAGQIDRAVPDFGYKSVLARVLGTHTEVLTAENTLKQARIRLRLAEVQPVPDVGLRYVMQKDNTTPPFGMVHNVEVGIALPVWDRNQGNIQAARANVVRASEGPHRARNELTAELAAAFERYLNNRALLEMYRDQILPDQVRAYRGAYQRHNVEPERVGFGEVVNAQQTLAQSVRTYLDVLGDLWDSVAEVAGILQADDLFLAFPADGTCPVPELDQLLALPCHHPCSPWPDPALHGADPSWLPPPAPEEKN